MFVLHVICVFEDILLSSFFSTHIHVSVTLNRLYRLEYRVASSDLHCYMKLKIIWQMVNIHDHCALIIIVFICKILANNINHLGEGTMDLHRLHTGGQRGGGTSLFCCDGGKFR